MGQVTEFFKSLIYGADGKVSPAKIAGLAAAGTGIYGALNPASGIGEFLGMSSNQRPVGYSKGIPEYGVTRALLPDAFANTTLTGAPRVPGSGGRQYFTNTTYAPTGKTMSSDINPVNTTTPAAKTPDKNVIVDQMAQELRQGKYTPATAATQLNTKYPGYGVTEESVIFELLDRGQTTPQEVATYYADKGYGAAGTAEGILSRYKQLGGKRTFATGGLASLPQFRGYYLGGTTDGMADRIPANINGQQEAALSDGEFVMPADVVSHLGNGNSDAGARVLYSMMDRVRQARTGTKEQGRKITPNKFTPA